MAHFMAGWYEMVSNIRKRELHNIRVLNNTVDRTYIYDSMPIR